MMEVKRREPLHLAHVLAETERSPEHRGLSSTIPVPIVEKRIHTRFDKAFLVVIGSEIYGDSFAVARNISAGGILVEMTYAPPLGTVVTVHFQHARDGEAVDPTGEDPRPAGKAVGVPTPRDRASPIDEIVARAEVKHHYYLNFTGGNDAASSRAIGLRFLDFVDPDERIAPERWH